MSGGRVADVATLVLTLVGPDRAGLVAAVAEAIETHGGNWERSQLAELSGAFAGIVEVSVPTTRLAGLRAALNGLDGLLTLTVHDAAEPPPVPAVREVVVTVLGNDRPGIVREVSATLHEQGLSVDSLSTQTREAPMAGGRLFEARVVARAAETADPVRLRAALERLAAEIQVDLALG